MPLYFIENRGQLDEEVAYYVQGSDKSLYFTAEGITFALQKAEGTTKGWALKLDFLGADPDVKPRGEDKQRAIFSYFKGKPEEWRAGIPTFRRLVYEDLWPGIDLVYSGTVNKLKYEFVVEPGADPKKIKLSYRGVTEVSVKETGELSVSTPLGGFEDGAPYAYQVIEGEQKEVSMRYSFEERSGKDSYSYGFEVGAYDETKPLVLDPVILVYCGYLGGSSADHGYGMAVDGSGHAYVAGKTYSNFPVVVGPFLTYGGSGDAFVTKVKADGSALVYSGYIGGSSEDCGNNITVDGSGHAYVTGYTMSTDFPVKKGPYLSNSGLKDAFVAKVEADGTGLVYSGYLGGAYEEYGHGIAVDETGNAYVAGTTLSMDFPTLVGPFLSSSGVPDAFVAKVKADGTGLVYSGYLGGLKTDYGHDIAVDGPGAAYVTGLTYSEDFPVQVGPFLSYNGAIDGYVSKIKIDGSGLVYSGYLGGGTMDHGDGITVDGSGHAYVTGATYSSNFPVKVGPYLTKNGSGDVFVTKVKADGTDLVFSGFIGGSQIDSGNDVALDGSNNVYVTGYTSSYDFPVLIGPYLSHGGGTHDAFVAEVKADGSGLIYAGYIGGSENDYGYGIAVDDSGHAFVAGDTKSPDFPVVVGPFLPFGGSVDAFVAKVEYSSVWYVDDNNTTGPWLGTQQHPFQHIQDAIDSAVDEDSVIVMPGSYIENLDYKDKAIAVQSFSGPQDTIIDGNQAGPVVTFKKGEGPESMLQGFTLKNGHAPDGGGVYCYNHSSPTIQGNIITGNIATSTGGGIFCYTYSSPFIANNFIHDNDAGQGGGIRVRDHSDPVIVNNTIVENSAANSGGGIHCASSDPVIFNCILWNNSAPLGPQIHSASGNPAVSYSDVEGGFAGTGNINENPRFSEPMSNDFHLDELSPCINRGTNTGAPATDFDGDLRPCMGTVDMGADEYTSIHVLSATAFTLSEITGGTIFMPLDAGVENKGRGYAVLGSVSGTNPGTPLPKGKAVLPLNWDYYTNLVLNNLNSGFFQNFYGTLDSSGQAMAILFLGPAPGSSGLVMSYAYALLNPFDFASNPVNIEIVE